MLLLWPPNKQDFFKGRLGLARLMPFLFVQVDEIDLSQ